MDVSHPVEVGDVVYIETTTKYWVGEVAAVAFDWITIIRASWIPDTGRFHEAMRTGEFKEVEPCPPERRVRIPVGQITDLIDWPHALPTKPK